MKSEIKGELREVVEEQGKRMREEIEVLKNKIKVCKEKESKWEREKKELLEAQVELRRRIERMDMGENKVLEGESERYGEENGDEEQRGEKEEFNN